MGIKADFVSETTCWARSQPAFSRPLPQTYRHTAASPAVESVSGIGSRIGRKTKCGSWAIKQVQICMVNGRLKWCFMINVFTRKRERPGLKIRAALCWKSSTSNRLSHTAKWNSVCVYYILMINMRQLNWKLFDDCVPQMKICNLMSTKAMTYNWQGFLLFFSSKTL